MKTFSEFQARNLDGRRKKKCEFGDDEKKQIKKKMIFRGKLFRLAPILFLVVSSIDAIISRSESKRVQKKNGVQKHDNQASQTVKRDYLAGGFEDSYDYHGGNGLSAHSGLGLLDNQHEYDGYQGEKHHGFHHLEESHLHHHHLHHVHKHQDGGSYHKALAIKELLVPLAGVALLGAAAAFVSNPILLQLGVISGVPIGRRKREIRREANNNRIGTVSPEDEMRLNEIKLLKSFMAQIPEQRIEAHEKKILANYLSCPAANGSKFCLERLACELHSTEGISMPMEVNVFSIIVNEILQNDLVAEKTKNQILQAVERGEKNLSCQVYVCEALEVKN